MTNANDIFVGLSLPQTGCYARRNLFENPLAPLRERARVRLRGAA